ncbi:unnamed protein product [Prunus armeniaca]|uniref:Uncharacterized protein n=1 Tax=Prunus armeniaca TaxID=36596 RepID=A0A6J5X9K5_PRUAR|nr:unnamed protein product [Prunus armeniaca]
MPPHNNMDPNYSNMQQTTGVVGSPTTIAIRCLIIIIRCRRHHLTSIRCPPNNMGGVPPNNMRGMPPNNMGGVPPPPNNMGGPPPNAGWGSPGQYQGNYTPGRDDGGIPGTNRY